MGNLHTGPKVIDHSIKFGSYSTARADAKAATRAKAGPPYLKLLAALLASLDVELDEVSPEEAAAATVIPMLSQVLMSVVLLIRDCIFVAFSATFAWNFEILSALLSSFSFYFSSLATACYESA